jgi:hypothetical protein
MDDALFLKWQPAPPWALDTSTSTDTDSVVVTDNFVSLSLVLNSP